MNKCFSKDCANESETEFCPECLLNGGFKPKDYVSARLDNAYSYHAPKGDQTARYEAIRSKAKELAHMIDELCPNSREKSVAQTNLEQTTMWANASIARNDKEGIK
ncbi:Acb2/Tad1 domain-containing protein [Sporosarcina sp. FA9]|uniref:Acb2/Tad1 domain-containing protein n=1 Tax=Sporosarcina sp. FA9 TaxID=3413030 RepID=UPI003F65FADD